MMSEMNGRSALITGAASGIGRATALAFAREGASPLVLNDINAEGLEKTVADVEALGAKAKGITADVSDFEAVRCMVAEAIDWVGRLDFLVNVAGLANMAPIEQQELADWKRIIDVDLWGPIHTVMAAYPHMVENGSGHIVNVASISGLWADQIYIGPYLTAKHGVVGLCEALKAEGFLHGIRVTCICPGMVQTNIWEVSPLKGFREDVRGLVRYFAKLGELPEDTARTIIKAIRNNKYIQVTTPFQQVHFVMRRHFLGLFNRGSRLFFRFMAAVLNRYRE